MQNGSDTDTDEFHQALGTLEECRPSINSRILKPPQQQHEKNLLNSEISKLKRDILEINSKIQQNQRVLASQEEENKSLRELAMRIELNLLHLTSINQISCFEHGCSLL